MWFVLECVEGEKFVQGQRAQYGNRHKAYPCCGNFMSY